MSEYEIKPVYLALSLCDGEGQYVSGFALKARAVEIYALYGKDIVMDVVHTDGEKERITFKAVPGRADITSFFQIGILSDYIVGMRMTGDYPHNIPISKEEFRKRCGTGRLLNELGHFVES